MTQAKPANVPTPGPVDVVRAKRIELVDDEGKTLVALTATLWTLPDGDWEEHGIDPVPAVALWDAEGRNIRYIS